MGVVRECMWQTPCRLALPQAQAKWSIQQKQTLKCKTAARPGPLLLPYWSGACQRAGRAHRPRALSAPEGPAVLYLDPADTSLLMEYGAGDFANLEALQTAVTGLQEWRRALAAGQLPERAADADSAAWPGEPLFSRYCAALRALGMPRFTSRHPELIDSVIRSLVDLVAEFHHQTQGESEATGQDDPPPSQDQDFKSEMHHESIEQQDSSAVSLSEEDVAERLVHEFQAQWAPGLGGLGELDQLFGTGHGLLVSGESEGAGGGGFGLAHGVWTHTGWQVLQEVQTKLKGMRELRDLIRSLGRHVSVAGTIRAVPPTTPANAAPPGVGRSPSNPMEVANLTRSGDLARLLPSEMSLLARSREASPKYSRGAKRLLLAKLAERSLHTYELTGWEEDAALPRRNARRRPRKPTSPGGPVIVCLDTSWSMEGPREGLAKALVVECVRVAHQQRRPCYLYAFSAGADVAEIRLSANRSGLTALLDFLGGSFRGGTDVTSPLKASMAKLQAATWANADILLVSDGELATPPMAPEAMKLLQEWRSTRGLEVHGLLVGKPSSVPLDMICTQVDNFLDKYDPFSHISAAGAGARTQATMPRMANTVAARAMGPPPRFKIRGRLHLSLPVGTLCGRANMGQRGRTRAHVRVQASREASPMTHDMLLDEAVAAATSQGKQELERTMSRIRTEAAEAMEGDQVLQARLQAALDMLSEGLIERSQEVKLLLLAALSGEHLLLLGPPGTAKSELGRRLASLFDGNYFERLLTRFTTPEELFGPLSLAALEQDRFMRNVEGYLPTAKVTFLDEVFKANSAILNTLLTVLNERAFDNGSERVPVPLICVVAASNELPESEELEALYDRFLLRRCVSPVSDDAVLRLLATPTAHVPSPAPSKQDAPNKGTKIECHAVLTEDEIKNISESSRSQIDVPMDVLLLLRGLRIFLRDEVDPPVYISDRRLKKATDLLRVSARAHGRAHVTIVDTLLLQHIAWYNPDEQEIVANWLQESIVPDPQHQQIEFVLSGLYAQLEKSITTKKANEEMERVTTELDKLEQVLKSKIRDMCSHLEALRCADKHLWVNPEEGTTVRQQLFPVAEAHMSNLGGILTKLYILKAAVTGARVADNVSKLQLIQGAWGQVLQDQADEQNARKIGGSFGAKESTHGDGGGIPNGLSSEKLQLSRKQARSQLTTQEFALWRTLKKTSDGGQGNAKVNTRASFRRKKRTGDLENNDEFDVDDNEW